MWRSGRGVVRRMLGRLSEFSVPSVVLEDMSGC